MKKLNNVVDVIIARMTMTIENIKNTNKKHITLFALVLTMIVIVPFIGETYQHQYKQLCVVYEIDNDEGLVVFIDPTGELFAIEAKQSGKGAEEYNINDAYMISFFDGFTDYSRKDDVIVKIKRVD